MAEPSRTKQNPPDEPERRNRVSTVATEANAAGMAAFARAGFRDPTLILHWAEIAGPEVADIATPMKLSEGPSGAVLTLKAEPGAAVFLQHETRALCERINGYLGRPAVARLRFVQGPVVHRIKPKPRVRVAQEPPPGDAAFSYRGPDKLREALLALARARRTPPRRD